MLLIYSTLKSLLTFSSSLILMVILSQVSETSSRSNDHHYLYDVFISYRGVDTRYSFTNHLHRSLVDASVTAFLDDEEIQTGLYLKPELEIAIKRSRASIIVLSKNFASSSWCLDELVFILSCSHIVIPVFYHVEPTDVRKQQNSFGEAMRKHKQRMEAETDAKKKAELAKKIGIWKESLTQVANLIGYESKGRLETELILEIVKDIGRKLGGPLRNLIEFKLDDIKTATENFADKYLIGYGTYGKVYKGELKLFDANISSGIEGKNPEKMHMKCNYVAIKHILNDEKGHGKQGFFLEIEMLGRCRHPNIVSLLGYCNEDSEMILVSEFVPNGSLYDYLENIKKETNPDWFQRINICLDIAYGLDYLHTNITDKEMIIHRDIKSANILLDKNFEAKIADFGLSKFYHENESRSTMITSTIAGTDYYTDPVYLRTRKLKKASDIYSLGVVLFEILSGRLANDELYCAENIKGLAAVARKCFNEGTLVKIIDPNLMEEGDELRVGPNQESLEVFAEIAFRCLAKTQDKRPTIKVVIEELQNALNLQVFRGNPSTVIPSRFLKGRTRVKRDLYLLKLEVGDDLSDHIASFNHLVSELSNMDEMIKEQELGLLMLASLPKSYKLFVQHMRTERTTKLEDVLHKLRDYTSGKDGYMYSGKGKRPQSW
ncbi:uncharacterized protein [Rutidosis leptorrhynchoides]|uniref:uncharacterized protein n=1 Tax=Rutidosis leptorrhynchoides TaxID=125765 RepID=UPI003A994C57